MQRQLIHGVPYFTDKSNAAYLWDTDASPPINIGTYNPTTKTVSFHPGVPEKLTDRLEQWRANQTARPRKATASKRRGNSKQSKGDAKENSSDDE